MRRLAIVVLFILAGCQAAPVTTPAATVTLQPVITATPTPTITAATTASRPPAVTATATARLTSSPTRPLPTETPAATATATVPFDGRAVTFSRPDGIVLEGALYGSGATAVILSHMGEHRQETWWPLVPELVERGYHVLTYNMSFWRNGAIVHANRNRADDDLAAAMAFMREQGAERLVLIGASLGAIATAREADAEDVAAAVIIAARLGPISSLTIQVTPEDIRAIRAPTLFITSEIGDDADDAEAMYELAAEPRQLHLFPGRAHGTELFGGEQAGEFSQLILTFVESHAPARAGE
jgi:pimeloyl-ACP methyl ester carboxylesterase